MRYKYVKFRNFIGFDRARFEFTGSLIGIIGPNGARKSTIVEGLYSGTTGIFRKFTNLVDFVRDLPGGEKANSCSVEVCFEHVGCTYVVKRSITVTKKNDRLAGQQTAKLTVTTSSGTTEEISGVKNVDSRLREALGESFTIMGDYAFIEQGEISAIVKSDASARAVALHRLFGLHRFEKLWKLVGSALSAIPEIKLADDVKVLKRELTEQSAVLLTITEALNSLNVQLSQLKADDAQRDIDLWESAEELRDSIVAAEEKCNSAVAFCNQQYQQLTTAKTEAGRLHSLQEKLRESYNSAKTFLEQASSVKVTTARLQDLQKRAAEITNSVQQLRPPEHPSIVWTPQDEQSREALSADFSISTNFIADHADFLEDGASVARCPTCGQDIKNLAEEIEKHRRIVAEKQPLLAELVARKQSYDAAEQQFATASAEYNTELASFRKQGRETAEEYKTTALLLPQNAEQYSEEEQARRQSIISEFDGLTGAITTAVRNVQEATKDYELAKASVQSAHAHKDSVNKAIAALDVKLASITPDHIKHCRGVLQAASDKKVEVARLTERKSGKTIEITALKSRIERVEELQKQMDNIATVRSTFQDARDVLHRSNLPSLLARKYVRALNVTIRKFLDLFKSNFTAEMIHDKNSYDFRCTFNDTSVRSSAGLSGGEAVRFSICFLLAVNEVLSARLGVLSLDEPTTALDEDNIQAVIEVLNYVRQYACNSGMQVFLITHSGQLTGAFDQSIMPGRN